MLQNPELPNGCEVTSLAMALAAAGYPADKTALFTGYMPSEPFVVLDGVRYGPDPETAYAGDAASARGGWYCLEGPVMEAGSRWLSEQGAGCHMARCTGLSQAALEGVPPPGDSADRLGDPGLCPAGVRGLFLLDAAGRQPVHPL